MFGKTKRPGVTRPDGLRLLAKEPARVPGTVWLVGAGPGDPELLTVRAHRLLAAADVVAYDELVAKEILAIAPPEAELIPVGRRANGCRHHEGKLHPLVVARALAGRNVVRLKGGDPFVFGRGGEEAEELAAAGIPFAVVPGISAALGAAASLHIPLTHREAATSVTLATAHGSSDEREGELLAGIPRSGTLVLYMGLGKLGERAAALVAAGRAPGTPVAVVSKATLPGERAVYGTLATIADRVREADLPAPALVIVGEVVARAIAGPTVSPHRAENTEAPDTVPTAPDLHAGAAALSAPTRRLLGP